MMMNNPICVIFKNNNTHFNTNNITKNVFINEQIRFLGSSVNSGKNSVNSYMNDEKMLINEDIE